jgi:hypothetical protein
MPFKHMVDDKRDIVVIKATGKVSMMDIMSEIQKAIDTNRGEGVTRRLIDMTNQEISYDLEDAKKILNMMKVSSTILGSNKIAILCKEIPDSSVLDKIRPLINSPRLSIKFFTDKGKAAQFFNKPS